MLTKNEWNTLIPLLEIKHRATPHCAPGLLGVEPKKRGECIISIRYYRRLVQSMANHVGSNIFNPNINCYFSIGLSLVSESVHKCFDCHPSVCGRCFRELNVQIFSSDIFF